jgi:hypothetical protein
MMCFVLGERMMKACERLDSLKQFKPEIATAIVEGIVGNIPRDPCSFAE